MSRNLIRRENDKHFHKAAFSEVAELPLGKQVKDRSISLLANAQKSTKRFLAWLRLEPVKRNGEFDKHNKKAQNHSQYVNAMGWRRLAGVMSFAVGGTLVLLLFDVSTHLDSQGLIVPFSSS